MYPAYSYSDNTFSESITPSLSPMPLSREKTQTLSLLPLFTPTPYWRSKTASGHGTTKSPLGNGTPSAKKLMNLMRKWRLRKTRIPLNKTNLRVRRTTLLEYIGFTIFSPKAATPSAVPQQASMPTTRLLCTNLPQEVTDDMLSVLFQHYVQLPNF